MGFYIKTKVSSIDKKEMQCYNDQGSLIDVTRPPCSIFKPRQGNIY